MRKLATFAGAFAAGVFLAQYLLPYGRLLPCAFGCLGAGVCALFLGERWRRRVLLAAVGLSLALGYDWLYVRQVQAPMEALADTEQTAVTMTLQDYPVSTGYGAKATVRLPGLGRAVYYGGPELLALAPGQTVTDDVRFQSAARIRDDDVTTFTSKGVFLLAYRRGEATFGPGTAESPRWWPARAGQALRTAIRDRFDGDTGGFLTAILTGDKSGLSESAASDLSEAGLYHILAVSGMHCMFLLTVVTLLAGRHRRRLVAGVTLPLLAFYAALTGGSPSVLRACVMVAFLLAAPLLGRDSDGPTALTAALLCILLANPFAAASISLQLSFGAMAGLLWLTPRLQRMLTAGRKRGRVFRALSVSFSATMGALVFTVPLSAWYFGTLVLVSPLSNLLCLWAAGVVFVLGLAAVLAGLVLPPLGAALGLVPQALIWYMLRAAHLLARLPYHALYTANPYLKVWLAYAYALFAAAYLLGPRARRKYALAAALAAGTLALTAGLGAARYGNDLDILVLDVGQGQSVLLASGGAYALVDCGSANGWKDPAGTAADQLLTMGCRRLDTLLLTHFDEDHVNGVTGLLARLDVGRLLVPDVPDGGIAREAILAAAEAHDVAVETVSAHRREPLGKAELTVFPPLGEGGDNERGLAVLCTLGDYDLLVTGDMDAATEGLLLAAYDLPDIEALVAGHHGSKYSTSEELLAALTPETACISVGSNRYGHPADQTLRRLAASGAAIYRTDLQGDIHISVN